MKWCLSWCTYTGDACSVLITCTNWLREDPNIGALITTPKSVYTIRLNVGLCKIYLKLSLTLHPGRSPTTLTHGLWAPSKETWQWALESGVALTPPSEQTGACPTASWRDSSSDHCWSLQRPVQYGCSRDANLEQEPLKILSRLRRGRLTSLMHAALFRPTRL